MKRPAIIFVLLFASAALHGQAGDSLRVVDIEEVKVARRRIVQDIGAQKTVLDSVALRDDVTNSMADVLSRSSSVFIKSYGRATLATASFRGTAPSHTQVSWNGMKINSPMLGMVDFSMIPSYFIDDANLYHGASSVGVTGGGLGGAVSLSTKPAMEDGIGVRYIQGIGSFKTFDEFLRVTYGSDRLQSSTRIYYATSDNDFKYTNYRKKNYIYDDDHNITGWENPVERNRNGSFKDLHVLQEIYYDAGAGDRLSASVWYTDSRRGVPMLNTDRREANDSRNRQNEKTVRATVSWDRYRTDYKIYANGGYTYTDLLYLHLGDNYSGALAEMTRAQNYVHTVYARFGGEYYAGSKWMISGNISAHQHFVENSDRAVLRQDGGEKVTVGYDQARIELSAFGSVKYLPTDRVGLALNIREEMYGSRWTPVIPAFFADYLISKKGGVKAKASVARNYRYPTLNDLYFMPGGNDSLKTEKGYTYDIGMEFQAGDDRLRFEGEATAFDSHVRDWILWLGTSSGHWTPVNIKKIRSYGFEAKAKLSARWGQGWSLRMDGIFAMTNAVNRGDRFSPEDESVGKQLVYIPKYSSAVTGKLGWRSWIFTYKWNYYSERFTTSSNDVGANMGRLQPYLMNDVSLERSLSFEWARVSFKVAVNNLFNEEYESVLSRPMAGRNYGFYIEITPKFKRKR